MPLPMPRKDQTKKEFLDACMANPTMKRDFKNREQRFAVCNAQWKKAKR